MKEYRCLQAGNVRIMNGNNDEKSSLSMLLKSEVDNKNAAGVQLAVYQNDKEVWYDCFGYADIERKVIPDRHTIYRLYSMSKPVTAVAAAILIEEGRLGLDDELAEYFPVFKNMYRLDTSGRSPDLVRCKKPVRIRDLLAMTSGIVYPDPDPAGMIMQDIFDDIHLRIRNGNPYTTSQVTERIAHCPLAFEPGEEWRYGLSADVLGAVIEKVSDCRFSEFLKTRIFEPLEMEDTDFYVPDAKTGRLAQLYKINHNEKSFEIDKDRHLGLTSGESMPAFESGGAGLFSTIDDYSHFALMLCRKGNWKNRQILKSETVRSFTRSMIRSNQINCSLLKQMKGYGYGYLMRVYEEGASAFSPGTVGEFGWDGWSGPYMSVDITGNSVILYMTQISGYSRWDYIWKMRRLIWDEVLNSRV